jgi:type IV pilus assembly protein PilB
MNILIGELLKKAGLITQEDINEALQIAKDSGMRVGQVLIVSGYITEEQLKTALEVQQLLKTQSITLEQGLAKLSGLNPMYSQSDMAAV